MVSGCFGIVEGTVLRSFTPRPTITISQLIEMGRATRSEGEG